VQQNPVWRLYSPPLSISRLSQFSNPFPLFNGKPIIGITGGIGSGKSTVARMFAPLGCLVIESDEQVKAVYRDPQVVQQLRNWWGEDAITPDGQINRSGIARIVFADLGQRQKLEVLLHPKVAELRDREMAAAANNTQILAFVWDTPLLFEVGLNRACDAVIFVDAPPEVRLARVRQRRGWDEQELGRREILQWPLDKKKEISDYIINNTADADNIRRQVREVLFRILARRLPEEV
jgi:dephospho-CoA kinase